MYVMKLCHEKGGTLHRNASLAEVRFSDKHVDQDAVPFAIFLQRLLEHVFHFVLVGAIQSQPFPTETTGNILVVCVLDKII